MAITSGFLEYVLSYLKRGVELGGFPEDFYQNYVKAATYTNGEHPSEDG